MTGVVLRTEVEVSRMSVAASSATSGSATSDSFELFPPGSCDALLPLNQIADVFRFSKFVRLQVNLLEQQKPVVLRRSSVMKGLAATMAAQRPESNLLDLEGGFPLGEDPGSATISQPIATAVQIQNVDELLAARSLTIDGSTYRVDLDARAARALMGWQPTAVRAVGGSSGQPGTSTSRLVRLVPQ